MTKDDLYRDIANKWRAQSGIGSVYAIEPVDPFEFAIFIIKLMRSKNADCKVLLYCNSYSDFDTAKSYVNNSKLERITIVATKYTSPKYNYKYDVVIALGFNVLLDSHIGIIDQSKFKLILINKYITEPMIVKNIDSRYPIIQGTLNIKQAEAVRESTPVEEWRVDLVLSDTDREQYDKFTDYITQTISIFGDFDTINRARVGDKFLNIPASSIRDHIARQNGWCENLDTTIDFNRQIDEYFNPNALFERATNAYNIMRERNALLTDNEDKLQAILDIVNEHKDKRIIIVSKHGEYARKITKFLVDNGVCAGDYHDSIEPMQAVDRNGIPILVKSGAHKGEVKVVKAKAISSENLRRYNMLKLYNPLSNDLIRANISDYLDQGGINVLSIKNSSSDELECMSDVLIFTSSLYADWNEFRYRFNKVKFVLNPLLLYKVYFKDTMEENALLKVKESANYVIHKPKSNLNYDENIGGIVC